MRVNVVNSIVGQLRKVDLECLAGTRVINAVSHALSQNTFQGVDLNGD